MSEFMDQRGRQVGWLLAEIEHQTQGRLSDEVRQSLIREVASHLDAAIHARLDAGMNPLEAEVEAVKAFGPPSDYIEDILKVHSDNVAGNIQWFRGDRSVMISYWLLTVSMCARLLSGIGDTTIRDLIVIAGILGSLFAFCSFRSRRIQLIPLASSSILATFLFTIAVSMLWTNFNVYGGSGIAPTWEIPSIRSDLQREVRILQPVVDTLQQGFSLQFPRSKGAKPAFLTTEQRRLVMSIPVGIGLPSYSHWKSADNAHLELKPGNSLEEAKNAWKWQGQQMLADLDFRLSNAQNFLSNCNNLGPKRYWAEFAFNFFQNVGGCAGWFVFTFFVNLIFGGLGILARRISIKIRLRTA